MEQIKDDCGAGKTFNTAVNERVKQVRLALGLSQAKFCRDIFLTSGHYAEIELGNRRINARIIKLIGVIYGVNEHFLKTGEGNMFDKSADGKIARIVRIFEELPPDFQDYILQQVEQLKKLHKG
ncbi:MAG: helix-turn-helix domain-containing protein [Spirochaetaceae bacterium]|jgi:transcriptional regulator with XRE-family HTH domain|nr:helix-turn-helix domain-containing protein [Spirochaetaceae bacterium]